jgi:Dna[CI] antecedent, DciA
MSNQANMERASRLLGKIPLPRETYGPEGLACAAWPEAVGKKIAAHAHAAKMVRTSLIVEVEDEIWRMQLYGLRFQILSNLCRQIGKGFVEEIEFRVVPRRREPQRAKSSTGKPLPMFDDAERIDDPGLRRLYRADRTKALA